MNNRKRGLELAAAIITIVGASILGIGSLVILLNPNQVVDGYMYDFSSIQGIIFLLLCASITMIILGAILCTNPMKNGVYNPRFGVSITLLVLLGLFAVFEIQNFLYFALFATPFGLLLGSVCMKNPVSQIVTTTTEETNNQEEPEQATIIQDNNTDLSVEEQLKKLKELKELGVLDEEQYKNAVEKILSKL